MRLREIRRARNITQQQLGEVIGVNNSIISKYEKGLIEPPAYKLARMAEYLQVSVDEILETSNEEKDTIHERITGSKYKSLPEKTNTICDRVYVYGEFQPTQLNGRAQRLNVSKWNEVDLKDVIAALSWANPLISQDTLAKQLNISPADFSRIVTGKDCLIREEWIPVLNEYLQSIDFSAIISSMNVLQDIATRSRIDKEMDEISLFLENYFSDRKETYKYDINYWGIFLGIIRFFDETSNRQWLFRLGSRRDAESWRLSRSGFGPFTQFRQMRPNLSQNDKVSILYFDQNSFEQSVKMSSHASKSLSDSSYEREKLPCCQSLILCNLENQSIEAEFELTDNKGESLAERNYF